MAQKRMKTYIVTVQFYTNSGKPLNRRKLAENALTSQSAVNKIKEHYKRRGDKIDIVSVISKY